MLDNEVLFGLIDLSCLRCKTLQYKLVFVAKHYGISCLLLCFLHCVLIKQTCVPGQKRTIYDVFLFCVCAADMGFRRAQENNLSSIVLISYCVTSISALPTPIILLGSHSISCVAFFLLLIKLLGLRNQILVCCLL